MEIGVDRIVPITWSVEVGISNVELAPATRPSVTLRHINLGVIPSADIRTGVAIDGDTGVPREWVRVLAVGAQQPRGRPQTGVHGWKLCLDLDGPVCEVQVRPLDISGNVGPRTWGGKVVPTGRILCFCGNRQTVVDGNHLWNVAFGFALCVFPVPRDDCPIRAECCSGEVVEEDDFGAVPENRSGAVRANRTRGPACRQRRQCTLGVDLAGAASWRGLAKSQSPAGCP